MYWNGDGVDKDRDRAAKLFRESALNGNKSAPALLAEYYFTKAAAHASEQRIEREPAIKMIYWGMVATRSDPDTAARQESQRLMNMLLAVAPDLKTKAEAMISTSVVPDN
jgi:TPR repeat protein